MDTRKYYNRYQRTMPQNLQRTQIAVVREDDEQCLKPTSLAMVYAPEQCFTELYELSHALTNGTIFKQLNMPFKGTRC